MDFGDTRGRRGQYKASGRRRCTGDHGRVNFAGPVDLFGWVEHELSVVTVVWFGSAPSQGRDWVRRKRSFATAAATTITRKGSGL